MNINQKQIPVDKYKNYCHKNMTHSEVYSEQCQISKKELFCKNS